MVEHEIIEQIVNGDKAKFEIIIRKYNQRLFRIGKGILNNDDEVEDALQEAYIKAYNNLKSFERRSSFTTWLSRILINECLMLARKRKQLTGLDEPELEAMQHFSSDPEHLTMNNELKNAIEQAIQQLPEKYRLVFMMREVENVSVAETGEVLELSEGNVKARLSRAKEMLRSSLLSVYPSNELFEFNLIRCDRIVKNVITRI